MELLKLRPAYQRAGIDEFELSSPPPPDYISSGLRSVQSFTSAKSSSQEYSSEYALLESDITHPKSPSKSRWTIRFEGWRTGASTAAVCALASLIINLVVALWLASKGKNSAILEVYQGNCDTVAQADIWVHLAINVLSTLLLGGSNFCSAATSLFACFCAYTSQCSVSARQPGLRSIVFMPKASTWTSVFQACAT